MKPSRQSTIEANQYKKLLGDDAHGIEVFGHENGLVFMGFGGRRQTPDFHLRFASTEKALVYIDQWAAAIRQKSERRVTEKKANHESMHLLKVGEVLMASWGYDQTNITYYQVTRLVGTQSVEIREIAGMAREHSYMEGETVPALGHFKGEVMQRRVIHPGAVRVQNHIVAMLKVPVLRTADMRIYMPDRYSSYA